MTGWKTKVGAILVSVSAALKMVCDLGAIDPVQADAISTFIMTVGAAFGLVGLAHKIEKGRKYDNSRRKKKVEKT